MDLRQLLATNIRRLSHERKVSQEQLAHDAGIGMKPSQFMGLGQRAPEVDRASWESRALAPRTGPSFLSDECPRIGGLISDLIPIEVLTADALVSSQIVTRLGWLDSPYGEAVAAFCAGRRLPFRRRQSRAMASPMLSLLMNRPVVFHAHAAPKSQSGSITSAQLVRSVVTPRPDPDAGMDRAYLSRVERPVTYVGLEIIEKLATILEVDPAEFFRRPNRSGFRRKAD
jgi:DNA-binding Xre family transcriptional regulator